MKRGQIETFNRLTVCNVAATFFQLGAKRNSVGGKPFVR
jgi:hypothetical protein